MKSARFAVGDRVVYTRRSGARYGMEAVIVSREYKDGESIISHDGVEKQIYTGWTYVTNLTDPGGWFTPERYLAPVPDGKVCEWSDCEWSPVEGLV